MKNLYVVSILAAIEKGEKNHTIEHDVVVPITTSLEQAEFSAMKRAFELWPTIEGWYGHTAKPRQVTDALNIPARMLDEDDEEVRVVM